MGDHTINPEDVNIEESWKQLLWEEFSKPYFKQVKDFLVKEKKDGKVLYPPGSLIFNAFVKTPVDKVKVVIIGQDPYHNPGQAMGLCFSVPKGIAIPASLKNIYKEMHNDIGFSPPDHGDLTAWAEQGVFLLNAMLTVEKNKAGSHRKIGWQVFTNAVIEKLSATKKGLVFLLWGNFAKSKKVLIDEMKHYVLESVHPSPLAGNAFQGCQHFSKTNQLLVQQGLDPIDWSLEKIKE
ncbi:MAG: uracil-DNA glycosylase [Saprospiraceae bacterium]|nr:uracil-DNA glycosylase [Saprospiraceae bacterium]